MNTSKQKIKLSILIPNYNGGEIVLNCIRSIKNQSASHSIEIIVHDDNSSDESLSNIKINFPEIIIIESKQNIGFCLANNKMAQVANGEFILLLNNDTEIFEDAISTLLNLCEMNYQGILTLPQYNMSTNEIADFGMTNDIFTTPKPLYFYQPEKITYVIGAFMFMKKSIWEKLGGFPDWMGSIAEDMYICYKARSNNIDVTCLNKSGYKHVYGMSFGGGKISDNQILTTQNRRYLSELNRMTIALIFYPLKTLICIAPFFLILYFLEALFVAISSPSSAYQIYIKSLVGVYDRRNIIKNERIKTHVLKGFFKPFQLFPIKILYLFKYGRPTIKVNSKSNN